MISPEGPRKIHNAYKDRDFASWAQTEKTLEIEAKRIQLTKAMAASSTNTPCVSCGHRVPITLRDLFWHDPFFSSNWEDFHKIHDEMMSETRAIWNKFDEQLKVFKSF